MQPVVRVEGAQILAARVRDQEVPCRGQPAVGRAEHRGLRPVEGVEHADRRGIGRTVVDDENLEVLIRLREDALDCLADVGAQVVTGDDHRDTWRADASVVAGMDDTGGQYT